MTGSAKDQRTRLSTLKKRGKGLRSHQNCTWYPLCTVCMASILPSHSHERYNPLLRCKGHSFLSNAEYCSAEQHKYLWKRRTSSGSSLKGSFNRQRTITGCYNTQSHFWWKFNSSSQVNGTPCEPSGAAGSGGTFAACRSDREWWQTRHPAKPLLGHTRDEDDSLQQLSHPCGQRHLWRGMAGTRENCL